MASLFCPAFVLPWIAAGAVLAGAPIEIDSLEELAAVAARDGVEVRMRPGIYRMTDLVPLAAAPERRKAGRHAYLDFSGKGSRYDLTGVVIEFDTALRTAHRPPIHTDEFVVSGSGNDILRETKGLAFARSFRLEVPSRSPDGRILPGYAKSLAEDGFRTYGSHRNLRLVRCKAVNLRGGFELRTPTGAVLEDCVALGCERGFWLHSRARAIRCKGDASNGPLLFLEGDGAEVDLTLLPSPARTVRHALATLQGNDHRVTLGTQSAEPGLPPILLGFSYPAAGEAMSPFSERPLRRVTLDNATEAPLVVGNRAEGGVVRTRGPVQSDKGRGVAVLPL